MQQNGGEYSSTYHKQGIKEIHLGFPHNMFTYFLACFGVIGIAGYFSYLIFTIRGLWQSAQSHKNIGVTFSLIMLFTAFFIEGCVDNTFNYKMPATLYFTVFGYLSVQYMVLQKKDKKV